MKVLTLENGEKKLVEVATTGKILGEKFYSEFYTPISPSFLQSAYLDYLMQTQKQTYTAIQIFQICLLLYNP
ncbi:MAG: hypothetical protein IPL26_00120 [Leptospiraceae bacterium]|nr:hypothetical protein [Leptospiraceae bacterium]